MTHSIVPGYFGWIFAALVILAGVGLYVLRKGFIKDLKEGLPKLKRQPKSARALKASPKKLSESETKAEIQTEIQTEAEAVTEAETESESENTFAMEPAFTAGPVFEAQPEEAIAVPELTSAPDMPPHPPEVAAVTSIHIAIWMYDHAFEQLKPALALEALSEFHSIGVQWAEKHLGAYERSSGSSFYIHWAGPDHTLGSLKCALELRQEFIEWNEMRKAEGYAPFMIVMGADLGPAIVGPVGPESIHEQTVVGEVIARSRALSQIAVSLRTDILVSEELWSKVSQKYIGERLAEAHLTAFENVTVCYRLHGYFGEHGQQVWVKGPKQTLDPASCHIDAPRVEKNAESKLWRVNNGSQILGPLTAKEVARALYALDLDFDCECWEEGQGDRVTIEQSRMFGTEVEPDARFWVFDGDTVHGPLTEGFLKTGMGRHVFPRDAYVCENSTVFGWKPLMEVRAAWKEMAQKEKAPIEKVEQQVEAPHLSFVQESVAEAVSFDQGAIVSEPVASEVIASEAIGFESAPSSPIMPEEPGSILHEVVLTEKVEEVSLAEIPAPPPAPAPVFEPAPAPAFEPAPVFEAAPVFEVGPVLETAPAEEPPTDEIHVPEIRKVVQRHVLEPEAVAAPEVPEEPTMSIDVSAVDLSAIAAARLVPPEPPAAPPAPVAPVFEVAPPAPVLEMAPPPPPAPAPTPSLEMAPPPPLAPVAAAPAPESVAVPVPIALAVEAEAPTIAFEIDAPPPPPIPAPSVAQAPEAPPAPVVPFQIELPSLEVVERADKKSA